MSTLKSTIETTISSFLASYTSAAQSQDPTHLSRPLAPHCIRRYAPLEYARSKGVDPDTYAFTNEQYEEQFAAELAAFADIEVKMLERVIDVEERKAWVWCQHHTILKKKEGRLEIMECVWMLRFSEDGGEIVECRQFMDTVACERFVEIHEGGKGEKMG